MRYLALACDYDGTLASAGAVGEQTLAALQRLLASGRKLILVTGRQLEELKTIFPHWKLFDRIVAENGAVVYSPATGEERLLGQPPPEAFVSRLRECGVQPLAVGRVIAATWHPQEITVLQVIRELGLEQQVIFNKGAVMVLPPGVNKCTGLSAAATELRLSPHNIAGIGDAENDHAFLRFCECSAAVANAITALKEQADIVTGNNGAGVVEFIDGILADDLRQFEARLHRHDVLLGRRQSEEVLLKPSAGSVLVAGPSGSGKSTVVSGVLERLAEKNYQFCLVDPEGDYENFAGQVTLGSAEHAPGSDEIIHLLEDPDTNAVVNLLGIKLADRPSFFTGLLPRLQELRAKSGRPHWLVIDEAHHLLPASWEPATVPIATSLDNMILITVHPDHVAPSILSSVEVVIAVGVGPEKTIGSFSAALGRPQPAVEAGDLKSGEAVAWFRSSGTGPVRFRIEPARAERRRHRRKYAEGELSPDRSFYFRGPEGELNLRAQNLSVFLQLAEGVDKQTWMHHLHRGDYSRWIRDAIKDDDLGAEVAHIEQLKNLGAAESRELVRKAVEQRYTSAA